jgi:hypothetical protein
VKSVMPFALDAVGSRTRTIPLCRTANAAIGAVILAHPAALFAAGLDEAAEYVSAEQALADGLPGVAAVKAERLLKRKGWTRMETRQLATFAAEAWTRAEEGARVLTLAETYDLNDEAFWRGEGLALTGNLHAARDVLTAADAGIRHPRTPLLLAQILAALGENAEALNVITPLLTAADPPGPAGVAVRAGVHPGGRAHAPGRHPAAGGGAAAAGPRH